MIAVSTTTINELNDFIESILIIVNIIPITWFIIIIAVRFDFCFIITFVSADPIGVDVIKIKHHKVEGWISLIVEFINEFL